ncbi:MAG: hypothetical protein WAT39_21980 [Planctomycetota bacterium]
MLRHLVVPFLIAPLIAQAQIAHANFDTFVFSNGTSMGGPNLLVAIKTTIPTAFVATRVEVFTGERTGTNTIALWSHDAALNQPQAPLGSGSWQMGFTNSWQGALLTAPLPLAANQVVWVVWAPQNGSQASIQAIGGAGAQQQRGSFDGGLTWNGPFQSNQWKFRIWSGPAGHYEVFGAGCAGTAGTPRLAWFGLPMAGTSFNVHLDRAVGSTVAGLIIGDSNTLYSGLPLPLSLASLGAPACSLLSSVTATFASGVDVTGEANLTLTIPANPTLAGFLFYNQWFCLDLAANPFGFTFSNGGAAVVGA